MMASGMSIVFSGMAAEYLPRAFFYVLERGLTASLLILVVVMLRAVFKRAPKWFRLVLWGFVAVRLLCPFALESELGLMPEEGFVERTAAFLEETEQEAAGENAFGEGNRNNPAVENAGAFGAAVTQKDAMSQNGIASGNSTDTRFQEDILGHAGWNGAASDSRLDGGTAFGEKAGNTESMAENAVSGSIVENEEVKKEASYEVMPDNVDINDFVRENLSEKHTTNVECKEKLFAEVSIDKWKMLVDTVPYLWLAGMLAVLLYGSVSYARLKKRTSISVNEKENIYLCDGITTPFVLGFFKPKIFLPSGLMETSAVYALRHEQEHLRCFDHWWKLLGFLLLAVYWFHPLLWAAYLLFGSDIEYACDERVVRTLEREERRSYIEALLSCSMEHRTMLFCPPSFVRNSVKKRVSSVVHYKKATFPMLVVTVVLCLVVGFFFLTDRKQEYPMVLNGVELEEKTAKRMTEEIGNLMKQSMGKAYTFDNFTYTFYDLQEETYKEDMNEASDEAAKEVSNVTVEEKEKAKIYRIQVEADRTLLVEPEELPLIQGMLKAQSEYSYQAERDFAQSGVIDYFLKELEVSREKHITEHAIIATVDEKGNYELWYGRAGETRLEDYFKPKSEEYQELLGYLTVYGRVGGQPQIDTTGSQGMVYYTALQNPETKVYGSKYSIAGRVFSCSLYYREGVYQYVENYEAKSRESLPLELLGEELTGMYGNENTYWSERNALTNCDGTGTLYAVKGYEDTFRVALYFEYTPEAIPNAETTYHLVVCDRLNDLWFYEGREVFLDRLHLEQAVSTNTLSMEDELWWAFLAELFDSRILDKKREDLPGFGNVAFQKLKVWDERGMEHSLTLYENGYVAYRGFLVNIEEDICRRVMEQIRAYHATGAQISFENAIPAEKILNREPGYEDVYERLERLLFSATLSEEFGFFGDRGMYLSKVPLRYYDTRKEEVGKTTQVLAFSEDLEKAVVVNLNAYYEDEISTSNVTSWPVRIQEIMKTNPTEEYLFLYPVYGSVLLDSGNEVIEIEQGSGEQARNYAFVPEENLYQSLYSDRLAVSYEELTAEENLVWLDMEPTKERLQKVCAWAGENSSYGFYDFPSYYIDFVAGKSGELAEVLKRPDVGEALLGLYEETGFYPRCTLPEGDTATEYKKKAYDIEDQIVFMEILLATDELYESLSYSQKKQMLSAVLEKREQRKSGMYEAREVEGFFSYIREQSALGNKWYDYIISSYWYDYRVNGKTENENLVKAFIAPRYPTEHALVHPQPRNLEPVELAVELPEHFEVKGTVCYKDLDYFYLRLENQTEDKLSFLNTGTLYLYIEQRGEWVSAPVSGFSMLTGPKTVSMGKGGQVSIGISLDGLTSAFWKGRYRFVFKQVVNGEEVEWDVEFEVQ